MVIDDSSQKKDLDSVNCVVSTTVLHSRNVTDVECLSKYCTHCQKRNEGKRKRASNYSGCSGRIKAEGSLIVFKRYEEWSLKGSDDGVLQSQPGGTQQLRFLSSPFFT
jgi:hypothetical protein